jgi:ATP-dependent DNA helicase RecG
VVSESQRVEWKAGWRDDYLRWVCGFANADGGTLVLGRDDDGVVVGLPDARRLLEELPNKVRDVLGIMVDVNLRADGGREYLEIEVPAYPNPISYRGEYYYRSGSTNQALKGAALDHFLLRKQGRHWDGVPAPGFTIADLSSPALAEFRRRASRSNRVPADLLAEPDEVLLEKLRLLDHGYVKRAGVLLFHEDPERLVTGAYVKVGFFRTDSDLLYHDEIHGDLFTQVERAVDLLLTKYLRAGISYEGVQRVETFPIPEAALREAVINAIAHKDYAASIPIQISVYGDKLMLWNPGQLPPDWTLEQLTAKHASVPHNPDVASVFFRAALLESWGRGIDLIRDACLAHGSPAPVLRWDNGLWVELPFIAVPEVGDEQTTQEPTQEPTQERIVALLRAQPALTRKALSERIGLTPDGIKYHLDRLRQAGVIRHVGPTKAGHWEVLQ